MADAPPPPPVSAATLARREHARLRATPMPSSSSSSSSSASPSTSSSSSASSSSAPPSTLKRAREAEAPAPPAKDAPPSSPPLPREPSAAGLASCDDIEAERAGLKAAEARVSAAEARLEADRAREQARREAEEQRHKVEEARREAVQVRLEKERVHLGAERSRLAARRAQLARSDAAVTSALGGAEAAYTHRGERFLDVIGLVAACGYAAEVSQCRALCGLTWRRGDLGATNDMIVSSLRLQCGAAQAREARRENFDFIRPYGDLQTLEGSTQLIRASILNNLPRVLQLIQLGAPLDLVDQSWRYSALHWASRLGHEHVVTALLEGKYKGADVDQVCGFGTALEWASRFGHVCVVRVLLARGAKQVRPGQNYTAMFWAANNNRIEVVKLLLAAPGASDALKTKDYLGRTPLRVAIDRGHAEILALLRTAGAPEPVSDDEDDEEGG